MICSLSDIKNDEFSECLLKINKELCGMVFLSWITFAAPIDKGHPSLGSLVAALLLFYQTDKIDF